MLPAQKGGYVPSGQVHRPSCFLATHGHMEDGSAMPLCSGRLIKAHLIPRQLILREVPAECSAKVIADRATWVPACGGPMGVSGHHGMFDYGKTLRLRYAKLPPATVEIAETLGLSWWLERTYR